MKIVLMILLSLLGLIALILLLLFFAVHVYVSYDGELKVKVRYLFITKKVFPAREKPKRKKPAKIKQKKVEKETQKKKKPKENALLSEVKAIIEEEGILGLIDYLKSVMSALSDAVKEILNAIVIKNLNLSIVVASDDAAETAISYGKICAGVYPAYAVLASFIKVKNHKIDIVPNFFLEETNLNFNIHAHIRPIRAVFAALKFFVRFLLITNRDNNSPQNGQDNKQDIKSKI